MGKPFFKADQPAMLTGYLYSIGYNQKNGIWKRGNSTVIVKRDVPVNQAQTAVRRKQVIIIGDPIRWSQRITGYEVHK